MNLAVFPDMLEHAKISGFSIYDYGNTWRNFVSVTEMFSYTWKFFLQIIYDLADSGARYLHLLFLTGAFLHHWGYPDFSHVLYAP
tara:strand:+ start:715 stop:969 length:255 start_codon:yes stop_codon:yes gene_type:complete